MHKEVFYPEDYAKQQKLTVKTNNRANALVLGENSVTTKNKTAANINELLNQINKKSKSTKNHAKQGQI